MNLKHLIGGRRRELACHPYSRTGRDGGTRRTCTLWRRRPMRMDNILVHVRAPVKQITVELGASDRSVEAASPSLSCTIGSTAAWPPSPLASSPVSNTSLPATCRCPPPKRPGKPWRVHRGVRGVHPPGSRRAVRQGDWEGQGKRKICPAQPRDGRR